MSRGIWRSHPLWRPDCSGQHETEFRLDIVDEQAVLSLRLTDAAFRFRSEQRNFSAAAQENLLNGDFANHSEHRTHIHLWDARNVPLDAGSVNKLVTNLPFGRQISEKVLIPQLYSDLLHEWHRILTKDGLMVCLTNASTELLAAAGRHYFSCREVGAISLKGLHPTLFLLRKQ